MNNHWTNEFHIGFLGILLVCCCPINGNYITTGLRCAIVFLTPVYIMFISCTLNSTKHDFYPILFHDTWLPVRYVNLGYQLPFGTLDWCTWNSNIIARSLANQLHIQQLVLTNNKENNNLHYCKSYAALTNNLHYYKSYGTLANMFAPSIVVLHTN